ncbi:MULTISPECIES: flagellar filament capping protein FliD [unclassified Methylophilus]|jgi:flagellar hook-associated protein 2|uniref:flagellar filament capping protein FliD n=1 Tax=unclassified Methylophilus TaxID=2630143 RepID=UPI0004635CDC|nr:MULTISPECIES: flagellar filament capping protein FliD [unclassified Methylophilus]HCU85637.1 flagellar hook protein [Methylophilus sp.]
MASIVSSTGASGLPIDSLVTAQMQAEQQPITDIKTKISSYNTKLSAYSTLKSGLSTFQTAVDKLATAAKFNAQAVTASDSTSISATANGTAVLGNYNVTVSQLATSQKLATSAYSSATDIVGTGKITISFGTYTAAAGATPASFTANGDKSDITIDITSSNNTLAGIRDAINAKNASVSASIVNDGTGNRLVITSKDTGEVNSLKISVADDDGNNTDTGGLSALAYDPLASSNNMTQMTAAKNALLTVDGMSISKSSNTVSDVIQGVTLTLKSVTSASNTLSVSTDTDTIQASVQSFVDAYNALNTSMRNLTKFVSAGSSSNGALLGDSTARNIMVKLKSMLSASSPTATTYKTLTDIGVTMGSDGSLSLDSTKLQKAVTNNVSDVAKLFSPSATSTDPQVTFVSSKDDTASGTYAVNITQLGGNGVNANGTINGVTAITTGSILTGASGNASYGLQLSVTGTATGSRGTVTFSKGLAGELSSLLDGWLDSEGALTTKTDGISSSIKDLNKKADDISAKLPAIEARYRAQYAKLDALLSSLQSTSSNLTSQLAAISANS